VVCLSSSLLACLSFSSVVVVKLVPSVVALTLSAKALMLSVVTLMLFVVTLMLSKVALIESNQEMLIVATFAVVVTVCATVLA
jgi:hypothetical protein